MNARAIPVELRELPRWVVWRWGDLDPKTGKRKKPPYRAYDLDKNAASTKPETWASFEQAVARVEAGEADGIGFALGRELGIVAVDLDAELRESDRGAIMVALDSYSERSPSGTGYHVLLRGSFEGKGRHPEGLGIFQEGRFFYVTGEHVRGTPQTIEERQAELERVLQHFLPAKPEPQPRAPVVPVDLDDRELLERARQAENGAKFARLWAGDTIGYTSHSEADLAFCNLLAFWTGRDPERMDRLFRNSGLMREKWDRGDYREETISKAIEATSEVFEPRHSTASERRRGSDAVADFPASNPAEGDRVNPTASARRHVSKDAPTTRLGGTSAAAVDNNPQTASEVDAVADEPVIRIVGVREFAAVEEPGADPLLGNDETCVLAADGSMATYGTGGASKTSAAVDRAAHWAAGTDWLGLTIARPVDVLLVENEGSRGRFRKKLAAKLDAWNGPPVENRLHVLEEPWGRFRFNVIQHVAELTEAIDKLGVEIVIAGPVKRLGLEGGGTPAEVQEFIAMLESVKADLGRPLAYDLTLHTNKAGLVSGDWEGATDTLIRMDKRGHGKTALVWEKLRSGSDLHGKSWSLIWRPGERFEVEETPERTEEDIVAEMLAFVAANPATSWTPVEKALGGTAETNRDVRERLLGTGELVNAGKGQAMALYVAEQAPAEQTTFEEEA